MLLWRQGLFENARDDRSNATAMPIIPKNTTESLEPVRVAYPREERIDTVLVDYYAGYFFGEFAHSARQPAGSFSAMKRQVGDACSVHLCFQLLLLPYACFVCFGYVN